MVEGVECFGKLCVYVLWKGDVWQEGSWGWVSGVREGAEDCSIPRGRFVWWSFQVKSEFVPGEDMSLVIVGNLT